MGADPDAGTDDAAEVLALPGHNVERGGGAEVDHDHRAAVGRERGDAVDDAVGAHVAGRLVEDRHPGAHARLDDERLLAQVLAREQGPPTPSPHGAPDRARHAISTAGGPSRARASYQTARRSRTAAAATAVPGSRPVSARTDVIAPRSAGGAAAGSSPMFIPTPTTTVSRPALPAVASTSTPPSLRPATRRSFGHLSRASTPHSPAASDAATPAASGSMPARSRARAGRRRTERKRLPSGESHARPCRPRPARCLDATTADHAGAPARARSFIRSLVDPTASSHRIGAGHSRPRAINRRRTSASMPSAPSACYVALALRSPRTLRPIRSRVKYRLRARSA